MSTPSRNVIVTGGSRGIGLAIARGFVEQGDRVLLLARKEDELANAKRSLEADDRVFTQVCDVSQTADVERVRTLIESVFEARVDVLVNAAGIFGPIGLLSDCDPALWKKTLDVNVFGTMLMCQLVLPFMKKQHSGCVINFSGGGEGSFPRFTAYAASKGAILRFTESLAEEVREDQIIVNAIAPGGVNTALTDEVLSVGPESAGREFYEKMQKQKNEGGTSPEFAVRLALFLASEKAGGITGKFLSALGDSLDVLEAHAAEITASDIYTVRRLKPKDRGYAW